MYTAIYYVNKVFPRLAQRLADRYFPLLPWEADHDLDNPAWADVGVDPWDDGLDDTEALDVYADNADSGHDYDNLMAECNACTESERYDDHIHTS